MKKLAALGLVLLTSFATAASNSNWVTAYSIPENNPDYNIEIDKSSINKSRADNKVSYTSRLLFLKPSAQLPEYLRIDSHEIRAGEYLVADVFVDCNTQTYALNNSRLFSTSNRLIMHCPWNDVANANMQTAKSGSLMENTITIACRSLR